MSMTPPDPMPSEVAPPVIPPSATPAAQEGPPPLAQCPNPPCRSFDVNLMPPVAGQLRTSVCARCGTTFPHPVGTTTAKRLNAKRRKRAGVAKPGDRPVAMVAASSTPVALLASLSPPEQAEPSTSDVGGLPTETAAHEPILWRWSEVAPEGTAVHRGHGDAMAITPERIEQWRQNVEAMNAAGHPPYVTTAHVWQADDSSTRFFREPRADETLAHIAKIKRDGGRVWALTGYYGPDSLKVAARNKFSVGIAQDIRDGTGRRYSGETLHHVSSTPDEGWYGTGTIKVAASAASPAGTGPTTVPVYVIGRSATGAARIDNPYLRAIGVRPAQPNPYLTALGR